MKERREQFGLLNDMGVIGLLQSGFGVETCFLGSHQVYTTLSTDQARFDDRVSEIQARPKTEWVPKPWPPKSKSIFRCMFSSNWL